MIPFPLFAAAAPLPFLGEVVALLVAAALVAYVCQRFGLVPIVGFLLAGVLIGPHTLGLVRDRELIDAAAEIGIILLLFTIGIEFSLEKLARIQRLIFGGGGLQVGLTTAVVTGLLMLFGVPWQAGVFTGFLAALSSTAIVLKLLSDRGETRSAAGETALGILLFQDLAVIVMVLLVPILAGEGGGAPEILWALGKAAGIILLVLLFARRIMPLVLERVARTCSPELFLLTVIAICLGTAWLTSLAGVSLSLGAFLAGLVVSESRFSEHALSEILPLQILFSATFFVSVGLLLDPAFLVRFPLLVAAVVGGVLLLKLATTTLSARVLGLPLPAALGAGLLLAQVGEFSFVLARAGAPLGLFPAGSAELGSQAFIAATVILMVLTPFLAEAGSRVQRRFTRQAPIAQAGDAAETPEEAIRPAGHVIVGGYGDAARRLVPLLRETGVPHVVLTLSPDGADEAELGDSRVIRGDYTRRHILELAGIGEARMLVVPDDEPAMAHQVVSVAHALNPELEIVVRTRRAEDAAELIEVGADRVVPDEIDGVVQLATHAASGSGVAPELLEARVNALRAGEYPTGYGNGKATPPRGEIALLPEQLRSPDCSHTAQVRAVAPSAPGCEECLKMGDTWVHLRICMTCGHVGCCDSSPNRHASKHFASSTHAIARSWEPGEDWAWCYIDRSML